MVTRALAYEPKGPRIDQEEDDYSSDDLNPEKREKPRKKKSNTQALVEFLNTTGPEEFQKQVVPKRSSTLFFRRRKKSPARPPIPPNSGSHKKYVEIVTNYPLDLLGRRRLSKVPSLTASKYSGFRRSLVSPDGLPNSTPLSQTLRKQKDTSLYSPTSRSYFSDLSNVNIHETQTEPPHYMVAAQSNYSIAASEKCSPAIPLKSSRRASPPSKARHGYALSSDSGMTFGNVAIWADSPLSEDTGASGQSRTPSPQEVVKKPVDRSRSMDNLRISNMSNTSQESSSRRPRSKSGSLASQWPSNRSVGSPTSRSDQGGKGRGRHRVDLVERALSQRIEAFRATKGNSDHLTPSEVVASQLATEHIRALQLSSVEQIETVENMSANTCNIDLTHQSILSNSSISPSHSNVRGNMALLTERKKVRHVQVQTMDTVEKCKVSTQTESLIVLREGNNVAVGPSGEEINGNFVACPSCSSIFHCSSSSDLSNPNNLNFDRKKSYSTPTVTMSQALKMYESSPQRPASAGASPPQATDNNSKNEQEDLHQQVTSLLHAVSELQSRLSIEQRAKKRLIAAMNDSNDKSELLSALAYKKLRELWEEKSRWEAACFELQERFTQLDQMEVHHDRMWSRDWNHDHFNGTNHVEESVTTSQDHHDLN